ncbi:MAG: hypothetical protein JO244_04815, partial [Solirubrobacterales bacterium]|nr:hypothetical protein [Solirubrobacterales bacterium]
MSPRPATLARIATATVLAVVALLVACSHALADADPASDILLGENVFYPYNPPVSPALQARLNGVVAAAHRAKLPLKVALIASPVDLGAIPTFFDKPASYAAFLDQEISFGGKPPLLVVMPNGYGAAGLKPAVIAAVSHLPRPTGASGNALAQAAISAVPKLAAASGHALGEPTTGPSPASGNGSGALLPLLILAGVCVLTAGGIIA